MPILRFGCFLFCFLVFCFCVACVLLFVFWCFVFVLLVFCFCFVVVWFCFLVFNYGIVTALQDCVAGPQPAL